MAERIVQARFRRPPWADALNAITKGWKIVLLGKDLAEQ
jgi:hypothetical protein